MSRRAYDSESAETESFGESSPSERQSQNLAGVIYNTNRKRARTHHTVIKRHANKLNSEQSVKLVPITLDLEIDGIKIKDTFTWNLNESLLTPEQFAKILVADIDSPSAASLEKTISSTIRSQCQSFAAALMEETDQNTDDVDGLDDLRITVKLDIHVGLLHLRDRFEWPLFRSSITPEDFAKKLASDLGVGGEFISQISHSIREQVCLARMDFQEATTAPDFGRLSKVPYRNEGDEEEWAPELRELDDEEIERINKERERNARRLRRTIRSNGRGPSNNLNPNNNNPNPNYVIAPSPIIQQVSHIPTVFNNNDSLQQQQAQLYAQMKMHHSNRMSFPFIHGMPSPNPNHNLNHNLNLMMGKPFGRSEEMNPFAFMSLMPPGAIPNFGAMSNNPNYNPNNMNYNAPPIQYIKPPKPNSNSASPQKKVIPGPEAAVLLSKQLDMIKSSANTQAKFREEASAVRKHRGFGASAKPFNEDGAIEVSEHRKYWKCTWCHLSGKYTPTLRKGPLGSKTLCNACGIWFGKHGSLPEERFQEHIAL